MWKNVIVFFLVFLAAFFYVAGEVKGEDLFLEITHVEEELEEHCGYEGYKFRVTLSDTINGEIYCPFVSDDGFLVGPSGNKSVNPTVKIDGRYGAVSSGVHYFVPHEGRAGTVSWQVYHEDYGCDFYELYIDYNDVSIQKTDNILRKKSNAPPEAEEILKISTFLKYRDPNTPSSVSSFYPEEPVELMLSTTSQGGIFYDADKNILDEKKLNFPEGVNSRSFYYSDSSSSMNTVSGKHQITILSKENEKHEEINVKVIPYIEEIFLSHQNLSLAPEEEWTIDVGFTTDKEEIYSDAADLLHLEVEGEELVEIETETGKLTLKPLEEGKSFFTFQDPLNNELKKTLKLQTAYPIIHFHELERNVAKNEIELKGLVENPSITSEVYVGKKEKEENVYIWENVNLEPSGSWRHLMDLTEEKEGKVEFLAAVISGENTVCSEKREAQIDRTPPEVALIEPVENKTAEGDLEIIGSVWDDNLYCWELFLLCSSETSNKIAQGSFNLEEKKMALLNAAEMEPGEYKLLLKAEDKAGNVESFTANIMIVNKDIGGSEGSSVRRPREPLIRNAELASASNFSAGLYADVGNNVTMSRRYIGELRRNNSDLIIAYPDIKFLFPADNLAGKMEVLLTDCEEPQKIPRQLIPQKIWRLKSDQDIHAEGRLKRVGLNKNQGIFTFNREDNQWLYQGKDSVLVNLTDSEEKIIAVMEIKQFFNDVPEAHWAFEEINMFASKGFFKTEAGEDFTPSARISRAEFASLITRAVIPELEKEKFIEKSDKKFFRDVTEDSWYYEDLQAAYEYGLIEGKGEEKFSPAEGMTRQEMAVLISRILDNFDIEIVSGENPELIKNDAALWAQEAMERAIEAGIIRGYPGGYIFSDRGAARAEGVKIIHRVLDIIS